MTQVYSDYLARTLKNGVHEQKRKAIEYAHQMLRNHKNKNDRNMKQIINDLSQGLMPDTKVAGKLSDPDLQDVVDAFKLLDDKSLIIFVKDARTSRYSGPPRHYFGSKRRPFR